ncbi:Sec-independent protein translocase protein TatB [Shewanella ulleungensis]|jgi:sec-independent protein translocase protein TatB|uniref:Sec-independent protein translocase protein TatB n=1 Tax=Shewanella ulleungensis TaxID=2282699 RepID=A0ABQ2QT78_9GAMM|nr:Sec-independent protein translocase protein TatB [Shewanella ulleungensis]MCL1150628.1 Sec-independent protein translocase protein TatB [Shewanella ulleungensis]GGP92646.1 Sec-independent protein translocase protein TatB [Shewanella ulleungensis]
MFDGIGFMELLLIGVLGLVVLGPERLPVAVRSVTGWIRALKRMANSVKDELEQELKIEQLHADLKKAESKGLANLSPELKESIEQLKQAAESVNRPYKVENDSPVASTTEKPAASSTTTEQAAEKTSENSSLPKSNG